MVLNYQRWTPPCGCSFEEEVDSETGEIKLLFAHAICGGHEHTAKTVKNKVTKEQKENLKKQLLDKKKLAWKRNRDKNLDDLENHGDIKIVKRKIIELDPTDSRHALFSNYYNEQIKRKERDLDEHENERTIEALLGLESEYAFDGQEVYNVILEEHKVESEKIKPTSPDLVDG